MNEEKSLSDLINIISSRTNQDPELVTTFLTYLFRGIEKELLNKSSVIVPGLGTFKIIKSIQANKILFISDLPGDKKAIFTTTTKTTLTNSLKNVEKPLTDIAKSSTGKRKKSFEDLYKEYKPNISEEVNADVDSQVDVQPKESEAVSESEKYDSFESYDNSEWASQTKLSFREDNAGDDVEEVKEDALSLSSHIDQDDNIAASTDISELSKSITSALNSLPSASSNIDNVVEENSEEEIVEGNGKLESSAFGNGNSEDPYDILQEYKDLETKEPRRSSTMKVVGLLIIFIFIIFALFYFMYPKQRHDPLASPVGYFQSYALLDDVDSTLYIAGVIAETHLDFASLSKDFYGCEIFWPYIYKANEAVVSSPFEIKTGTIIHIPKVDKNIIDKNNKQCVDSANALVKEIISLRIKDN